MKKLVGLILIFAILTLISEPPIGGTAVADKAKPPSTTQVMPAKESTLTQTTHVEAVQAPPAPEVVPEPIPEPKPVVAAPVAVTAPSTHEALMAAAGISSSDYGAVEYIIHKESSWDPNATNASSGAHGLPQALPYSKTGCGRVDEVCQLKWADTYAKDRYGGWWSARTFWINNHYW